MFKRVNEDDDPDEFWFECPDCEGTGQTSVPVWDEEKEEEAGYSSLGTCPNCDGLGKIEGDADDVSG